MAITTSLSIPNTNPRWKIGIAVLAVLLLSAPSAVGVFRALEATRGAVAAALAAAGFELAYLSLSLLSLRPELRRQARAVALGAVITAIALNGLADYAHRVAGGLASWPNAVRLFDPLALALAILESAPLAGLSYALASLLHRLAEEQADPNVSDRVAEPTTEAPPTGSQIAWAREEIAAPELIAWPATEDSELRTELPAGSSSSTPARIYGCKYCGAAGLTKSEQMIHGKRHARERRAED
jgi:hypothetical protein